MIRNNEYKQWIVEVKQKIRSTQIKATIAVNSALIEFYWDLGKMISERQTAYGTSFIPQLSKDLQEEFPDMKGLSVRNLAFCREFYQFYGSPILQQPVTKLQIIEKQEPKALFYIQKTKENNWSRDAVALHIKSDLYARQGKAVTNFANTLPAPNSDLAQQTLKDPYVLDFLQLSEDSKERDIENQLTQHITRLLLELGKGFAFVELKNKDFEPEFAGKLNFYLTLIDKTMKRPNENPTIGILLCRGKDNLEVEYALQDIHKPMGVSEFKLAKLLPDNLKSSLPSIEELEEEIRKMGN